MSSDNQKIKQSGQNIPSSPAPDNITGQTANQPSLPSSVPAIQWGAYVGDDIADLTAFERLVGKSVNTRAYFCGWEDDFPAALAGELKISGKTLFLFWEQYGTTPDRIISGNYDSYIRRFAADAKNYEGEIILAPFHEMNIEENPWSGTVGNNTPAKVIAAWKHIHEAFLGAANVKFAWVVNNISVPDTAENAISFYYPGDDYVDYVGVDGFNFDYPWQSFDQIFGKALIQLKTYAKPVYISSFACAQGQQKADWIQDALTVQIPEHPEIKGWIWFNTDKEKDWRVNSDESSLAAFKNALP